MKNLFFGLLCLLASCATAPKEYMIEKTKTVSLSVDDATLKVVAWCFENDFTVMNNAGGVLVASSSDLRKVQGWSHDAWSGDSYTKLCADCGAMGTVAWIPKIAELNVLIQNAGEGHCKVTVNFKAHVDPTSGSSLPCNSKGVVERSIFAALGSR